MNTPHLTLAQRVRLGWKPAGDRSARTSGLRQLRRGLQHGAALLAIWLIQVQSLAVAGVGSNAWHEDVCRTGMGSATAEGADPATRGQPARSGGHHGNCLNCGVCTASGSLAGGSAGSTLFLRSELRHVRHRPARAGRLRPCRPVDLRARGPPAPPASAGWTTFGSPARACTRHAGRGFAPGARPLIERLLCRRAPPASVRRPFFVPHSPRPAAAAAPGLAAHPAGRSASDLRSLP